MLSALI